MKITFSECHTDFTIANNMNEKIKRLAKNVSELIPSTDTLQETYDLLTDLMKKQRDYFINFSSENIIKLLFYIWSYKQTDDFVLGDKLLNEISFAVLFETQGEMYEAECEYCDGSGETTCENCGGSGSESCDECNGSGEVNCPDCDGDGSFEDDTTCSECSGTGGISCGECGGDGEVTCGNCSGGGREECTNCNGIGEVQTDELLHIEYFIVTWDKFIKNRCEVTENDTEITMSEYEFDRLRDEYVKLTIRPSHAAFDDFIKPNEMYCAMYNDSPKMYLDLLMHLWTPNYNLDVFTI